MPTIDHYDVAVVGGGPAGAASARDIAAAGYRTVVLERKPNIGSPVQCSGLVTARTLEESGLSLDFAQSSVRGAIIFSPGGKRYGIGGDYEHAFVIDRREFDQKLMAQALSSGAKLVTSSRVLDIQRVGNQIALAVSRDAVVKRITAKIVVGADGPKSLTARFLGLPAPEEYLRARGLEVRLPRVSDIDNVMIFTGERFGRGFFAWAIPLGMGRFRIGWGTGDRHNVRDRLPILRDDYFQIFEGMEVISHTGGLIPLGARARTSGDQGMVVGDAAAQAKPTSGGGLFTTLRAAHHCADAAVHALATSDSSMAALSRYEAAWRTDIGHELHRAMILRKAYRQLTDTDIEWALRAIRLPGMRSVINRYGDIDFPSWLAVSSLRSAPWLGRLLQPSSSPQTLSDEGIAKDSVGLTEYSEWTPAD